MDIDRLFARARTLEPEVSFGEVRKTFLQSLLLAAGGVLATKGILQLITTNKWIIMGTLFTGTSAVVIGTAIIPATTGEAETLEPTQHKPVHRKEVIMPERAAEPDIQPETKLYTEVRQPAKIAHTEPVTTIDSPGIEPLNNAPQVLLLDGPEDTVKKVKDPCRNPSLLQYFVIGPNTTEDELDEIEAAADAAGIDMDIQTDFKRGKLFRLNMSMKLSRPDKGSSYSIAENVEFDDESDQLVYVWVQDPDGQAVSISAVGENQFYAGNFASCEVQCCLPNVPVPPVCWEAVELPEMPELSEFWEGFDTLSFPNRLEMEQRMREMELELMDMQRDLEKELKNLKGMNEEELKEMLRELKEERKEFLRELEEEIKALIEELEQEDEEN